MSRVFSVLVSLAGVVGFLGLSKCSSRDSTGIHPDTLVTSPSASSSSENNLSPDCESSTLKGPAMVEVSTPSGVKYCIDKTEVTKEQYRVFYNAYGDEPDWQDPSCKVSDRKIPNTMRYVSAEDQLLYDFSWDPPEAPMNLVSWCGATAYCNWAGKRLCGKVGGGNLKLDLKTNGAEHPEVTIANPEQSQWYNACSQGGKTTYATGMSEPGPECSKSKDASSQDQCKGSVAPFDQISGLYGGVFEWEDFWGVGGTVLRGGAANGGLSCASADRLLPRDTGSDDIGFRCCKD